MPHTFRKFAPCGARVSKDGGGRGVRAASCFETHRSAVVLVESHCGKRCDAPQHEAEPTRLRLASPQRQRLLVEHRLDRRPRGRNVEPVLGDEVLAVGRDRVDVLQHLEPLEAIVVV